MAATERVSLVPMKTEILSSSDSEHALPGLRIRVMARTTTASLSDYPEWKVDERQGHRRDAVVSDGACS
jgi:hypothetical protein